MAARSLSSSHVLLRGVVGRAAEPPCLEGGVSALSGCRGVCRAGRAFVGRSTRGGLNGINSTVTVR